MANDGGPVHPYDDGPYTVKGITLRDYFAAAALTGWMLRDGTGLPEMSNKPALDCYALADAMLAAREVK